MVKKAIEIAKSKNAYKIIGSCKKELLSFYESCGCKDLGTTFGLYLE